MRHTHISSLGGGDGGNQTLTVGYELSGIVRTYRSSTSSAGERCSQIRTQNLPLDIEISVMNTIEESTYREYQIVAMYVRQR